MTIDNHEFEEIYEKYKNLVLKTAYLHSGNHELAGDIMQDTFLALYKDMEKKESLAEYTNIKTWLTTTAKHTAYNYGRKLSRETVSGEPKENSAEKESMIRESTEEEYMDSLTEKERGELVGRIMSDLLNKNKRWHKAIMLTCVMGIPQTEAAGMMNMREDAFYVMLHRARNWIRKEYGIEYDDLNRL